MKLFLLIFIIGFYTITGFSQNTIKGRVIDSKNNNPLQFVNIQIKGTNIGTITNIEGFYQLPISNSNKFDTICFSYIGYYNYKICINDLNDKNTIKLIPFVTELTSVSIHAKKTNPVDILKKANENLIINSYDSLYNTKVFIRNFVKTENQFVSYRRTIADVFINKDDLWLGSGEIMADEQQSNKDWVINSSEDVLSSLKMAPNLTYDRSFNKSIFKQNTNYEIKIDTVIFSEKSKIYVVDVYNKQINLFVKSSIYKILNNTTSPYALLFDSTLSKLSDVFVNSSFRKIKQLSFIRYYIDAKQNYNVIKMIDFSLVKLSKSKSFIYNVFDYSNEPQKSNIKHTLTFIENNDRQRSKSIFETFCYDKKYIYKVINNQDKIYFAYSNSISKNINNWTVSNTGFIQDDLALQAISQVNNTLDKTIVSKNGISSIKQSKIQKKIDLKISLRGTVLDSTNFNPLEFCSVGIKNLRDSSLTGVITNENGYFNIDILLGNKYEIRYYFMGYKSVIDTIDFTINSEDYNEINNINFISHNLGTIYLSPDINTLKTVTIKASTKELGIDKESVIVTNEMKKNTIATKDILKKINGVKYNFAKQEIKVDNSNKVKLLVDGIDKDEEYILNLNPKRIKKIEILRNISGIYEMEGFQSIINIVTYDNYRGVDLKISEQYLDNLIEKNETDFLSNRTNLSVNYTYDKLNFYFKPFYSYSKYALDSRSQTNFNNGDLIINGNLNNTPNSISKYQKYGITGGIDYKINNKQAIGVEFNFKGFPAYKENYNSTFDTTVFASDTSIMNTNLKSHSDYNYYNANLYYKNNINPGLKLISYLIYDKKDTKSSQVINNSNNLNYFKQYSNIKYNIELNKSITSKHNLNLGFGYINNTYKSTETNNKHNNFNNHFYKLRFYSYFKMKLNKSAKLLFGASFENYNTTNDSLNYIFNALQPKLSFTKKFNTNNKINIEYYLKSNYPYLSDLSNQIYYASSYVQYIGNPELNPYLTHNLSFQYQYQSNKFLNYFSIKPFYAYSNNSIGYKSIIQDSILTYQKNNFVKHETYGVNTNLSLLLHDKLSIDFSANIFNEQNKNLKTPNIVDWTGSVDISYDLSPIYNLGVIYQKDRYKNLSSLGYNIYDCNSVMFYLMTLQLKGRLRLMFSYSIPLSNKQYDEIHESTIDYNKIAYSNSSFSSNFLMLDIVFRLFKGNVNKVNKKIKTEYFDKMNSNKPNLKF